MLFVGFITWNELHAVLRQREITRETISMAISVYLLLGVTWTMLYSVIYHLQPQAFSLNGTASSLVAPGHPIFPVLAYFSFITLTTVGYGDIAPVTLQARYAALAEAVTGQFYLAILVARLVSMLLVRQAAPRGSDTSSARFGLSRSEGLKKSCADYEKRGSYARFRITTLLDPLTNPAEGAQPEWFSAPPKVTRKPHSR
jgi:hypothetical protein